MDITASMCHATGFTDNINVCASCFAVLIKLLQKRVSLLPVIQTIIFRGRDNILFQAEHAVAM